MLIFCLFGIVEALTFRDIARRVPVEFDQISKIACVDRMEACEYLVKRFVKVVYGVENVALEDAQRLIRRIRDIEGRRARLFQSPVDFELFREWRKFWGRSITPAPARQQRSYALYMEVAQVGRNDRYFEKARAYPLAAAQVHFWQRYLGLSRRRDTFSDIFSDLFHATAVVENVRIVCDDAIFKERMREEFVFDRSKDGLQALRDLCATGGSFDRISMIVESLRGGQAGPSRTESSVSFYRSLFWKYLAIYDESFYTISKAIRELPLEYAPKVKSRCMRDPGDGACVRIIGKFCLSVNPASLSLLDSFDINAVLDCFKTTYSRSSWRRQRMILRTVSIEQRQTIKREAQAAGLWGRSWVGEDSIQGIEGFEVFFDIVEDNASVDYPFWTKFVRARTASEITENFVAFYNLIALQSMKRAFRRVCELREMTALVDTSLQTNDTKRRLAAACVNPPNELNAFFELFPHSDSVKQALSQGWLPLVTTLIDLIHDELRFTYLSGVLHSRVVDSLQLGTKKRKRDRDIECPICTDELSAPIAVTPCSHRFHSRCLFLWIGPGFVKGCPMCRATLPHPAESIDQLLTHP